MILTRTSLITCRPMCGGAGCPNHATIHGYRT